MSGEAVAGQPGKDGEQRAGLVGRVGTSCPPSPPSAVGKRERRWFALWFAAAMGAIVGLILHNTTVTWLFIAASWLVIAFGIREARR